MQSNLSRTDNLSTFFTMTKNMQALYMDIVASLGQLPAGMKSYIFGYEGEEDYGLIYDVTCHIALEFIKYSYDYSDSVYPLRHFLKDVDNDSERMMQQRIMQYVLKYKKRENEMKGGDISNKFSFDDMDKIEKKLRGYRITEMNYFEHQNIHDLDVIKSIVERRIVSSKKVSNARFQEMLEQYDRFMESLIVRSKLSDRDMVFASLALFTLEWHYPIEMFYQLSCIMEKEKIDTIDQNALALLCGHVYVESKFGGWIATDSRMIKLRIMILPYLFESETDKLGRETMIDLVKEILALVVRYNNLMSIQDGKLYKDWLREKSSVIDWASFFRHYDVFSIWTKKKWTAKRIQLMRYLFSSILCE